MKLDDIITTTLASSTIVGLAIYILKNYALSTFKKDLETHKHLLEIQMVKAQLQSKEVINVLQTLYEKIEMSFGQMSKITQPMQLSTDWSSSNTNDVVKYLNNRNATEYIILKFKVLFESNHPEKVKELNKHIKLLNLNDSERLNFDAKNYIILKALYLTEDIEKLSLDIISIIINETIEFESFLESGDRSYLSRTNRQHTVIEEKIKNLKLLLRKSLTPQTLE